MMILRNLALILSFIVFCGCSNIPGLGDLEKVLPDKRTAYQKSKGMATLEVPPDLTVTEGELAATIPGEESTSLSEFERQRSQNKRQGSVLGSGEADGEQWLALRGSSFDIWPKLKEFWREKEYVIDLDDAELGVLETGWKEDGGSRHKFKIFAEPDELGGTMLFMSSEKQNLSEGEWLDTLVDTRLEKNVIRKLNLHFYGTEVSNVASTTNSSSRSPSPEPEATPKPVKPKAEILDVGDGKSYLVIPQEFTRAWREALMILERAGYVVEGNDQSKGTYDFRYFMPEGEEEEKGLLSKLKFWGEDEDEGTPYQLSLTGVGDKTEVIIMNKDGEWDTGENVKVILDTLKQNYNKL
ncbi:MAG: lipoprotein [marine bacterium B5-7]|nr:MAG: lipoprotein [marine bacterium B5-7]